MSYAFRKLGCWIKESLSGFGEGKLVFSLPNYINSFLGINCVKQDFIQFRKIRIHARAWRREKRRRKEERNQESPRPFELKHVDFVGGDPCKVCEIHRVGYFTHEVTMFQFSEFKSLNVKKVSS